MNAIRLGLIWKGIEPIRGRYNQTFINEIKQIVKICNENEIYVLLDMHQDLLSEKFCGEGFPDWAALPDTPFHFPAPYGSPYEIKGDFPSEVCQ